MFSELFNIWLNFIFGLFDYRHVRGSFLKKKTMDQTSVFAYEREITFDSLSLD